MKNKKAGGGDHISDIIYQIIIIFHDLYFYYEKEKRESKANNWLVG